MKAGLVEQKHNLYCLRIVGDSGVFDARIMSKISDLSLAYGDGNINLTSRGSVEITGILEVDLPKIENFINEFNIKVGGTGNTVRSVASCMGSTCRRGLIDTKKLGKEIEELYLGKSVQHKFKVGIYGCNNSIGKAKSQDLGFIPYVNKEGKVLCKVYMGGTLGKVPKLGDRFKIDVLPEDIKVVVGVAIEAYNTFGNMNERFGYTIDRVGKPITDFIHKHLEDVNLWTSDNEYFIEH